VFSKKVKWQEFLTKIGVYQIAFAKSKEGREKKRLWAILHGILLKVKK